MARLTTYLAFFLIFAGLGCSPEDSVLNKKVSQAPPPLQPSFENFSHKPALSTEPSVVFPEFERVEATIGLDFKYRNGKSGNALMPESTGGGVGCLDYDRDGWQDLFFCQGGNAVQFRGGNDSTDQLFRNVRGCGFQDVSSESGLADDSFGQGLAIGDYDDDGFDDVFVTNFGENHLLRNNGDGTFQDVTRTAKIHGSHWSTSCVWCDLDLDGDLDLYICNYLEYDLTQPLQCFSELKVRAICAPHQFPAQQNQCWENLGNGEFREVLQEWTMDCSPGRSLGVVAGDLNLDGFPDLYVANDGDANHFFIGTEAGRFQEKGAAAGCAASVTGKFQASMGIACNDFDQNGYPDLYVTHFSDDSNTLYANSARGFKDVTRLQQLHKPTLSYLGFGCAMTDFNSDGAMDIFVANGHVNYQPDGSFWPMNPQLFSYSHGHWTEATDKSGSAFSDAFVGRGVALVDFNGDGADDIVFLDQVHGAVLLENQSLQGNWINIEFIGSQSNRMGLGARVILKCGKQVFERQLFSGGSYLSSSQPRISFGLGTLSEPCEIEVRWPSGAVSVLQDLPLNEKTIVREPSD